MIVTTSLHGQIEQRLKEEIVSGQLEPGRRIAIDELSRRWQVSATPIRDALLRLDRDGFVKVSPRRGVHVSTPDGQKFKEVFDLRIALECLAVRSATSSIPEPEIVAEMDACKAARTYFEETGDRDLLVRSDDGVHAMVLRHCGNGTLVETMDGLSDLIRWTRNIATKEPLTYEAAVPEHLAVLQALKSRDATGAEAAMRAHLEKSYERTRIQWKQAGDATMPSG